jgi:ABC-type spermidine/putrescine transport system permease subunit II
MIGKWLFRLVIVLVYAILLAPLAIVVLMSFSTSAYLEFPPPSLWLGWYTRLLQAAEWRDSIALSLMIAIVSMSLSLICGTAAAAWCSRSTSLLWWCPM